MRRNRTHLLSLAIAAVLAAAVDPIFGPPSRFSYSNTPGDKGGGGA